MQSTSHWKKTNEQMIAICQPEFHGDVLWSIPAAREMARRRGCQADFILTPKGARVADLLLYQPFVRGVVIHGEYIYRHGDSHDMDVNVGYDAIHQMGFRSHMPIDETLLDYFCKIAALPRQGHWLDVPEPSEPIPEGPFVVVNAKKHDVSMNVRWGEMWRDFVRRCPLPVVEVGWPVGTTTDCGAIDRIRMGFLEMAAIIAKCTYFFGHISAPLVIADAMPNVKRIAVHDGSSWDLRACTQSPMNHYPVCYDAGTLLEYIK
jgi:hypothetical protein